MVNICATQKLLFYPGWWSPELDSTILSNLIFAKKVMGHKGKTFSSNYIEEMRNIVEHTVGVTVEWSAIVDRLSLFESRYAAFTEVLKMRGTEWDEETNRVVIRDSSWEAALKRNNLLSAYLCSGDLAYHQMHTLYTMDEENCGGDNSSVINTSSDSSSYKGGAKDIASSSRSSGRSSSRKNRK